VTGVLSLVWRLGVIGLGALLIGGMGAAPPERLPKACEVLQALPGDVVAGQGLTFQTVQDHAGKTVLMSMCTALGEDDLPVITLLLRQDIAATAPQTALVAREAMIAELTGTFGHDPAAVFPQIGEAAMWVAEIGQLTVWYRAGRVMFIVTTTGGPGSPKERAEQAAQAIVARFP